MYNKDLGQYIWWESYQCNKKQNKTKQREVLKSEIYRG